MSIIIFLIYLNIIPFFKQEKIYNHSNNESNLYFVITSFRHGARYALVKEDVFKNKVSTPGKLTSFGEKQNLNIGKNLRKRYYNFLNLNKKSFDRSQIYIRTTNIYRAILSTKKQLEGLFNTKKIKDNYLDIINIKGNILKLYYINETEIEIMNKYFKECQLRKLSIKSNKYKDYFNNKIIPIYKRCYSDDSISKNSIVLFCDNTISSFYEYAYNKKKENKIGKCGYKTAKIFYNFCIDFFDSTNLRRGNTGYLFYIFFKYILKYINNAIERTSTLKMIMLGGHDSTVGPLMGFLEKINIVNNIGYPHYSFNIVFEIRKYNNEFYLEIYYNDLLKYNRTIQKFKNTLDNSKYSNYYNYCEIPSYKHIKYIEKKNNSLDYKNLKIYVYLIALSIFMFLRLVIFFSRKKYDKNKANQVNTKKWNFILSKRVKNEENQAVNEKRLYNEIT